MTARLAYRRMWSATADRLPGEPDDGRRRREGRAHGERGAGAAGLTHGGRALQPPARDVRRPAGRAARARRRRGSGSALEMAYLAPTFDGDSIWNVFASGAYRDLRGSYELQLRDGLKALRCAASRGTSRPRRASRPSDARWAGGGSAGAGLAAPAQRRAPRQLLRRRLRRAQDGRRPLGALGAAAARRRARGAPHGVRRGGRTSSRRPTRGSCFGAQAGSRYRLGEGVRLHLLARGQRRDVLRGPVPRPRRPRAGRVDMRGVAQALTGLVLAAAGATGGLAGWATAAPRRAARAATPAAASAARAPDGGARRRRSRPRGGAAVAADLPGAADPAALRSRASPQARRALRHLPRLRRRPRRRRATTSSPPRRRAGRATRSIGRGPTRRCPRARPRRAATPATSSGERRRLDADARPRASRRACGSPTRTSSSTTGCTSGAASAASSATRPVAMEGLATRADLPKMALCLGCHDGKQTTNRCGACHLTEPDGRLRTNLASAATAATGLAAGTGPARAVGRAARASTSTGPTFARDHAQAGRDERYCLTCHKRSECVDCHGGTVRPFDIHPSDYVSLHGIGRAPEHARLLVVPPHAELLRRVPPARRRRARRDGRPARRPGAQPLRHGHAAQELPPARVGERGRRRAERPRRSRRAGTSGLRVVPPRGELPRLPLGGPGARHGRLAARAGLRGARRAAGRCRRATGAPASSATPWARPSSTARCPDARAVTALRAKCGALEVRDAAARARRLSRCRARDVKDIG